MRQLTPRCVVWALLVALLAASAPGALAQQKPPTKAPRPAPKSQVYELRCNSLDPDPQSRSADCRVGQVVLAKGFFDFPQKLRLMPRPARPDERVPVLETSLLVFPQAKQIPDPEAERYQWTYRALVLWAASAVGAARPFAAGWLDYDSGRRFEGGATGVYDAARLRTPALKSLSEEFPERFYSVLKAFPGVLEENYPEPLGPVSLERKGRAQGVCAEQFATDASLTMLESAAEKTLMAAVGSDPELARLHGAWQGTLLACPGEEASLKLRVRGPEGLSVEADCEVSRGLIVSGARGIVGACVPSWGTELRRSLLQKINEKSKDSSK